MIKAAGGEHAVETIDEFIGFVVGLLHRLADGVHGALRGVEPADDLTCSGVDADVQTGQLHTAVIERLGECRRESL